MRLPEGYQEISAGGTRAFAWSEVADSVVEALRTHGSLHRWAAASPSRSALSGRGTVLAVDAPGPGPDRRARWAVRRYLRGGAVARILGDRYARWTTPRAVRELAASCAVRARGIPTPAVVAGAIRPAGLLFRREELITELVPEAPDLASLLLDSSPAESGGRTPPHDSREATLRETGRLIARIAAVGVLHVDLNAKNVVLETTPHGPAAHLIDLDRCVVRARPDPGDADTMRARLERSLRKIHAEAGQTLPAGHLAALADGMAEASDPWGGTQAEGGHHA